MSDFSIHQALCEASVRMLRRPGRFVRHNGQTETAPAGCMVAGAELNTGVSIPDAFGWGWRGTHVVECKTTRRDFLKDCAKWHRQQYHADYAIGQYRWYVAPSGVITPEDDLNGWGLMEIQGTRFRFVRPSRTFDVSPRGHQLESAVLLTITRMYAAAADVGPGVHTIGKYRISAEPWRGPRMRERLSKGATVVPA